MSDRRCIVFDPAVQFGEPCLSGSRLQVAMLARLTDQEAAEWYDLTPGDMAVVRWFVAAYRLGRRATADAAYDRWCEATGAWGKHASGPPAEETRP